MIVDRLNKLMAGKITRKLVITQILLASCHWNNWRVFSLIQKVDIFYY